MIPSDGGRIIQLVDSNEYATALGVTRGASISEIGTAHLRLVSRFRAYPDVVLALNRAKAELRKQQTPSPRPPDGWSPGPQPGAIRVPKYMKALARVVATWPVMVLAVLATGWILWRSQNLLLTIAACLLLLLMGLSSRLSGPAQGIVSGLALLVLLWGGFALSLNLMGDRLLHMKAVWRIILGIILGLGLMIYPGLPLTGAMTERFRRQNFWNLAGTFCILFMVVFGLPSLLVNWRIWLPQIQKARSTAAATRTGSARLPATPSEGQADSSNVTADAGPKSTESLKSVATAESSRKDTTAGPAMYVPRRHGLPARIGLAVVQLLLMYGVFLLAALLIGGSNWAQKWEGYSEVRFCTVALFVLVLTQVALEAVFYIPGIGEYIGGAVAVPRQLHEPMLKRIGGMLLFNVPTYGLVIPLYLVFARLVKSSFSRSRLSFIVRVMLLLAAVWTPASLVNWLVARIGLVVPAKQGFAAFLDSLLRIGRTS